MHIPVYIHVNVRFIVHNGSITGGLQLLECREIGFQLVVLGQCGLGEGLEEELLGFDVGEVAGWLGRVCSGEVKRGLGKRVREGWEGLLGCGCHSFLVFDDDEYDLKVCPKVCPKVCRCLPNGWNEFGRF